MAILTSEFLLRYLKYKTSNDADWQLGRVTPERRLGSDGELQTNFTLLALAERVVDQEKQSIGFYFDCRKYCQDEQ